MRIATALLIVHSVLQVVDRRAAVEPPRGPLKLVALQDAGFNFLGFVSIDIDTGKGLVEIDGRTRRHRLSPAEMRRLESAVQAARFWELAPSYGDVCWECGSCTMAVEQGGRRHEVIVNRYVNTSPTKKQREDVDRALRVWGVLKSVANIGSREDACR